MLNVLTHENESSRLFHDTENSKFRRGSHLGGQQAVVGNGYRGYSINNDQQVYNPNYAYNNFPSVAYYPYQYFQEYPQQPEEPTFVVVTPKSKPRKKSNAEPTTRPPPIKQTNLRRKPAKLRQQPKMDIKLVKAVQQPNSKFVIEKFVFVPGKRIAELSTSETVPASKIAKLTTKRIQKVIKSQKLQRQRVNNDYDEETATVKVESVGMTGADQPIPDYSAYFPRSVFTQEGKGEEATLILEPDSKSISGNGGTSISAPVSRAILRKGTSVKVLFKPQSVAITGANGIAHASADLLLDFIEDE